jgi:hypothetical protein
MSNIGSNLLEHRPGSSTAYTTVWTLDLPRIRHKIQREPGLKTLLGPSELARAAQYANPALSESYIAAHVGLRTYSFDDVGPK